MEQEDGVGGTFLGDEDGEDSAAGHSQRTYLAESGAETSAERSRRLATLTKKKLCIYREAGVRFQVF